MRGRYCGNDHLGIRKGTSVSKQKQGLLLRAIYRGASPSRVESQLFKLYF